MAIAQSSDPPPKLFHKFTYYANLWLKNPKFGGVSKKFLNFLTSQKSKLNGPANDQLAIYSNIQTKICRTP